MRCVERGRRERERSRAKGKVRHAYYRVRYALRDHLGNNDFIDVECSRRFVEGKGGRVGREEREVSKSACRTPERERERQG